MYRIKIGEFESWNTLLWSGFIYQSETFSPNFRRLASARRKAHLDEDLPPLLDDVGFVLQVVFGGLTDVDLHPLFIGAHTEEGR